MKKIGKLIVFVLVAAVLMSSVVVYADVDSDAISDFDVAADADSVVISTIKSLGIMTGDENGEFHLDSEVTRAEMAAIVVRMLRIDDPSLIMQQTVFSDVEKEYWASGFIAIATNMGIINGVGDGLFLPEESVSYQEAAKMLVCALGYNISAQDLGGYPYGYLAVAANLGITKNVVMSNGAALRGDIATLVYNALDIVPLVPQYGNSGAYEKDTSGQTLYEMFLDKEEMKKIEGILTQTRFTSLDAATPILKKDYVIIDDGDLSTDDRYKAAIDLNDYIGYSVECYAQYIDNENVWEIVNVTPRKNDNTLTTCDCEDVTVYDDHMEELLENGRTKTYSFSPDVKYIYNGRLIESSLVPKTLNTGLYRALDNSGDDLIDVLFIEETESFVVDRVNEANTTIYFKNRETFRGKNGFKLDYDTRGNEYQIIDEDSKEITFEDIVSGMGITMQISADETYGKLYISEKTVEGKITSVSEEAIEIDEVEYEIAKNSEGNTWFTPKLGDEGIYAVDVNGRLIDINDATNAEYKYAYVIDTVAKGGLSANVGFKLVNCGQPKKNVKVTAGDEIVSYEFQNNEIFELYADENVKYPLNFDDTIGFNDQKGSELSQIAAETKGTVIKYRLSSDGKIRDFDVFVIPSILQNSTFNADIMAFGGETVTRGYLTDANTTFICVPKKANKLDDDFAVNVKVTDEGGGYNVYGVTVDPQELPDNLTSSEKEEIINGEAVDFLVIVADMDSTNPVNIPADEDIGIVGKITSAVGEIDNELGDTVYKIEMLNGDTKVKYETVSNGEAFNTAARLNKGDLIQISRDGYGRINGIKIIGQIQGLGENYGIMANGAYYGLVTDIRLNLYDYMVNGMVDYVRLRFNDGTDNRLVKIFRKDTQPIYIYERTTGWIYPGTAEDIVSENQVGESGASKVYAYNVDGDATVIVVIKD